MPHDLGNQFHFLFSDVLTDDPLSSLFWFDFGLIVSKNTLLSIYYAIFQSHLHYASIIWKNNSTETNNKLLRLQNKALRIIHFKGPREPADPLYHADEILKFEDQVKFQFCLLAYLQQQKRLPMAFDNFLTPVNSLHNHNTQGAKHKLDIPRTKTVTYGSLSIAIRAAKTWNELCISKNLDLAKASLGR